MRQRLAYKPFFSYWLAKFSKEANSQQGKVVLACKKSARKQTVSKEKVALTRSHVALEDQHVLVRLVLAQLCHILGRLPIPNAWIMKACSSKYNCILYQSDLSSSKPYSPT